MNHKQDSDSIRVDLWPRFCPMCASYFRWDNFTGTRNFTRNGYDYTAFGRQCLDCGWIGEVVTTLSGHTPPEDLLRQNARHIAWMADVRSE